MLNPKIATRLYSPERVIENATKAATRNAYKEMIIDPSKRANRYGVYADLYTKTYHDAYQQAKIEYDMKHAKVNKVAPEHSDTSAAPQSDESYIEIELGEIFQTFSNSEPATAPSEIDPFAIYLQKEFPIPQLFSSISDFTQQNSVQELWEAKDIEADCSTNKRAKLF